MIIDKVNYMKMKSIVFAAVLSALCATSAFSGTSTIIELGQGGTLNWNGLGGTGLRCTKGGHDCKVTITTTVNSIVSSGGGGTNWHIDMTLTAGGATYYPVGMAPQSQLISVNNFTFVDNGYLVIEAGWFTGVPPMQVPMENLTSDGSGNLVFDIAKTACIY